MRKTLYIFYIPILIIEWVIDAVSRLITAFHDCLKELAISIKTYINEPPVRTQSD
jgi:hypothetical protein